MKLEYHHSQIGYKHRSILGGTSLVLWSGAISYNSQFFISDLGNNHNLCLGVVIMADEQLTKNVAYIILGISFLVMMWFIIKQAKQNREDSIESSSPNIAGSDERPGNAINPEQFDEPDEEALEEMADLLEMDED